MKHSITTPRTRRRRRRGRGAPITAAILGATCAVPLSAQAVPEAGAPAPQEQSQEQRITVTWLDVPVRDVLLAFADFSGRSIVAGPGLEGTVTAEIKDQPWDVAFDAILTSQGLVATEDESGIIQIVDQQSLYDFESFEPILTRVYRISYVPAIEILAALQPLLTERGSISVSEATNSVIVSDIARIHHAIAGTLHAP